jgi:hypothetical protein
MLARTSERVSSSIISFLQQLSDCTSNLCCVALGHEEADGQAEPSPTVESAVDAVEELSL